MLWTALNTKTKLLLCKKIGFKFFLSEKKLYSSYLTEKS